MVKLSDSIDYSCFKLKRIKEPQYRHFLWLLFWPIYWLRYPLIELFNPAAEYKLIQCFLDNLIPFNELFLIPYMLWMPGMLLMCVYALRHDTELFMKYSKFLTIAMSISSVCFLVYPSCQNLRPTIFPRDNFLTDCVKLLYAVDTSTNVFPSEHVIGSIAVWLTAMNSRKLRNSSWIMFISLFSIITCLSTVFLKQHSVLDAVAAVPVCAVAYYLSFIKSTKGKDGD